MYFNNLTDAQRRILLDYLEARLVACEIVRARLNLLLDSSLISEKERAKAIRDRDAALVEWGDVFTALADIRSGIISPVRD